MRPLVCDSTNPDSGPASADSARRPWPRAAACTSPTKTGDLYVVRAGKTFQVNATNSFNETIFATPALDGNLLIVRTRGHLIALGTI